MQQKERICLNLLQPIGDNKIISPEKIEPKRPQKNIKDILLNYWGIWVLLAFLFLFSAIKIMGTTSDTGEEGEVAEAAAPSTFGEPEYVGSKRCKDCHWREYDTWKDTLHFRFIQYPGRSTVGGDFISGNELAVKVTDRSAMRKGEEITRTMFKKDGMVFVNTIGPEWEAHVHEVVFFIVFMRKNKYHTKFPHY